MPGSGLIPNAVGAAIPEPAREEILGPKCGTGANGDGVIVTSR